MTFDEFQKLEEDCSYVHFTNVHNETLIAVVVSMDSREVIGEGNILCVTLKDSMPFVKHYSELSCAGRRDKVPRSLRAISISCPHCDETYTTVVDPSFIELVPIALNCECGKRSEPTFAKVVYA